MVELSLHAFLTGIASRFDSNCTSSRNQLQHDNLVGEIAELARNRLRELAGKGKREARSDDGRGGDKLN